MSGRWSQSYVVEVSHFFRKLGSRIRSFARATAVSQDQVLSDERAVAAEFDAAHYLASYSDIGSAGVDPLDHFIQIGWKEGRNPNAVFDTKFYLANNRDIAASRQNPFVHYVLEGRKEGRAGSAQEERLLKEESDYTREDSIPVTILQQMTMCETAVLIRCGIMYFGDGAKGATRHPTSVQLFI